VRRCAVLVGVVVLGFAPSLVRAGSGLQLTLRPSVTMLHQRAWISVAGVTASSLDARLLGATTELGKQVPWTKLTLQHGVWRGRLPAPALRGVYAVELRTGSLRVRANERLRVYELGTMKRPSFKTPEDVVRWWVRTVPRGDVVALRRWPRPAFDLRDRRLHQLLVVSYSPSGDKTVGDRLGMFVTAVREGTGQRWRLLEATVAP
jgi:hypothetical protein